MENIGTNWRKQPPDEQGYWWWWNEDGPPIPVSIFASGHVDPRYFATVGQHGWTRAQWVEDMGGMWMRLEEPECPGESPVRCSECGAKLETHDRNHLCRMHLDLDGYCLVCGSMRYTLL